MLLRHPQNSAEWGSDIKEDICPINSSENDLKHWYYGANLNFARQIFIPSGCRARKTKIIKRSILLILLIAQTFLIQLN